MSIVEHAEKHKFSYSDYLTWEDDQRWEIIDGEPRLMSPAPNRFHQTILRRVAFQTEHYLQDKTCEAVISPFDVRLEHAEISDTNAFNVVQPDLLVVCDPAKLENNHGCIGAPDWVIEIISPSTASHDHIVKRALYERFGVKEYWIIQPMDCIVMVYQLSPEGFYGKPDVYSETDIVTVGVLPELQIDLQRVFKGIAVNYVSNG
jgi:Uma2 family endonuclease